MMVFISNPYDRLEKSLDHIFENFQGLIDPAKGFFLKPNIVFPARPNSGEITPPKLVKAVVAAIRKRYPGNSILLGEGTAAGTVPEENFRESGYREMVSRIGVPLLDLDGAERIDTSWKYGTLSIPTVVYENNYINLPILKLSAAAVISGAMKNQKGLLTPSMKKHFHRLGLHDPIAELTRVIRPHLTILDGSNFFRRNLLVAGGNVCDIDRVAASLLQIEEPEYLRLASRMGLRSTVLDISGYTEIMSKGKPHTHPVYKKFMKIRLWSNPRACTMCRMAFFSLKKIPLREIGNLTRAYSKMLRYAVQGADFVFGSEPMYDQRAPNVICIGECTKELAREKGYQHIPGCPSTDEEFTRNLP